MVGPGSGIWIRLNSLSYRFCETGEGSRIQSDKPMLPIVWLPRSMLVSCNLDKTLRSKILNINIVRFLVYYIFIFSIFHIYFDL